MPSKQRILFVDDESKVLDGLRRMLHSMRLEWEMQFANSGAEALELMAAQTFDVIVSDMRMPGMTGVELLNEVRARYPQTVRLALSGEAAKESILSSVGPIHQYLPKPCDADTLKKTLKNLCRLRGLLTIEKLQGMITKMEQLPSLPSLHKKLLQELASPDVSVRQLGDIVSQDIGMSTKVLQLVNSAFFGMQRHIESPSHAVVVLGVEIIKALATTACVFSQFEPQILNACSLHPLWKHSIETGMMAKQIAGVEGMPKGMTDHALIAGFLHDVGKLALASMMPDEYGPVRARAADPDVLLTDLEREAIGATHSEVGAYLLGLWGFPAIVMEAVAFHHNPADAYGTEFSPLIAVHVANFLSRRDGPSGRTDALDAEFLRKCGMLDRLPAWQQACQEPVLAGVES